MDIRRASVLIRLTLPALILGGLGGCEPVVERDSVPPGPEPLPEVGTPDPGLVHVAVSPTPAHTPAVAPPARPTPPPTPKPTPIPKKFIPWQQLDLAEIYNGIELVTDFETSEGGTASAERAVPESFRIEMRMHVAVPRPGDSLDDLAALNPALPEVLPGLPGLIESSAVSPYYHGLYQNKTRSLQRNLTELDEMLSRHNFYDTQTILEMTAPDSGRRVLLMQSDMDVNGDGSDGDRMLPVDQTSTTFQPWTSYRWPKRTDHPNEFLAARVEALREAEERYAVPGLSDEENYELVQRIRRLKLEIADLETWSFLLSRADPFIVVPGFLRRDDGPFAPSLGDFAAVIHGDTIYPAIVGDVGPSHKNGEASLRICRELDPESGAYRRPESGLEVTYLVFPGTADKPFGPPDLDRWNTRVAELIDEIGGHQGTFHNWTDITTPPPTPTPDPTPDPTPVPPPPPGATAEPVGEIPTTPNPEAADQSDDATESPAGDPVPSPAGATP